LRCPKCGKELPIWFRSIKEDEAKRMERAYQQIMLGRDAWEESEEYLIVDRDEPPKRLQ
jgi:hypothetical protein